MLPRNLHSTALVMRLIAWSLFPLLFIFMVGYPHGFAWGIEQGSDYHPYLWMMLSLYLAWCYLLGREAKNPAGAGLLFDFGIYGNILHALTMIVLAIMMWEHEMPHMWADIPVLFIIVFILWCYHPNRVSAEGK